MKVTIKYLDNIQHFEDKATITIGKNNCDMLISPILNLTISLN